MKKILSRYKVLSENKIENFIVLFLAVVVMSILALPFLHTGLPSGHDIVFHTIYLRVFTDALIQGQFPVHWIEWFTSGFSQPTFLFYQPLYFYLAQVPHLLGLSILNASKATVYSIWLLSGLFMFLFVRNITKNKLAGCVAAVLYIFAPYHIVDVFVRAAYPEATALACIPAVFWASERSISTGKRMYVILSSISIAAVFIAHPPTLIMFGLPYTAYMIFVAVRQKQPERLIQIVVSGILGLCLSAFSWLPAYLLQYAIHTEYLKSGLYDFHEHFVCVTQLFQLYWGYGNSRAGCLDDMPFQIGLVNYYVFIFGCGCLLYWWLHKIKNKLQSEIGFWLIVAAAALFMTTAFSEFIWSSVPYVAYIQFPWRFLSVNIFSLSVLGGIGLGLLHKPYVKRIGCIVVCIGTMFSVVTYLHPRTYFSENYFAQDSQDFYQTNAAGFIYARLEYGYFPKWTVNLPARYSIPDTEISSSDKQAAINVLGKKFAHVSYSVKTTDQSDITIFIHYFPGWIYKVDNHTMTPSSIDTLGYPHFIVSAGAHMIEASFTQTQEVVISNIISVLTILVLFYIAIAA